jgi:hypothetical protein
MGAINSSDRIAATLYSLGTWFVSGIYVCINTLHKGNNNNNPHNHNLTLGFLILAKSEYLMRHDKACAHQYYSICKAVGIERTDRRYTHMSKPVYEEGDVTVLCNQTAHTHRQLTAIGQI